MSQIRYVPRPTDHSRTTTYPWPAIEATLRNGQALHVTLSGLDTPFRNAVYQYARRRQCTGHVRTLSDGSLLVWLTPAAKVSVKRV